MDCVPELDIVIAFIYLFILLNWGYTIAITYSLYFILFYFIFLCFLLFFFIQNLCFFIVIR